MRRRTVTRLPFDLQRALWHCNSAHLPPERQIAARCHNLPRCAPRARRRPRRQYPLAQPHRAGLPLATEQELSDFLKSVEKRAFKRSVYHVRDEEAALDIVQDSMMKLAEHYGDKPAAELPMLFQRILSNCTLDWFRRQKTRNALFSNLSDFESAGDDGDFDLLETYAVGRATHSERESAEDATRRAQILREIEDRDPGAAGASTGSLSDALLGGDGRCRNGGGHGLLGRQCQNTLFAGRPGPEQSAEGKGNITMNNSLQHHSRRSCRTASAGRSPRACRRHGRSATRHRASACAPRACRPWPRARLAARRAPPPWWHRPRRRRADIRRRGPELVEPHRLGPAAGCAGGRPGCDQRRAERTAAPAKWPKSTPPC